MFIKRMGFVSILSTAITISLLALMAALIRHDGLPEVDQIPGHVIEFHRVIKEVEPTVRDTRPKNVELPPPMPLREKPQMKIAGTEEGIGPGFIPDGPIKLDNPTNGIGIGIYVAPDYPSRALRLGIEGYVIVEFTVTRFGVVENPRVIEAVPEGYFENAALDAIRKFKFSIPMIDGKAVDMPGMLQRFTFEMEKQKS